MATVRWLGEYPTRPFTRWWWFSGPIERPTIEQQLDWVAANGFGGVEIAWVYPLRAGVRGPRWLDAEWQALAAFAKRGCERRGLGCDFTFGTVWPFGGTFVPPEDASRTFDGFTPQRLAHSWEAAYAEPGPIVNHLSRPALERYAAVMGGALRKALEGKSSGLFCDSWEVNTDNLWSPELWEPFERRFGYSLQTFKDRLDQCHDARYDYRKFLARAVVDQFYRPFAEICRRLGARSRVQCHGSPTDLLEAYATADIPETEALLFPAPFARAAASAAALASKPVVSCETFTCMYGFPAVHREVEQAADLKLLADAVIAQGVNHVVWHGMPYNPRGGTNRFFASVHVGPDGAIAEHLPRLNRYLETVCGWMRAGKQFTNLAVYYPLEDQWMLDWLPDALRTPGAHHWWEMRYVVPPPEVEGFHPLWISLPFLRAAAWHSGALWVGDNDFAGLYVDCQWLDAAAMDEILRLAESGAPIVLAQTPRQPGRAKDPKYAEKLERLVRRANVTDALAKTDIDPLVEGNDLPPYWARSLESGLVIFFAPPKAKGVRYPMRLGQSRCFQPEVRVVRVNAFGRSLEVRLEFQPYQAVLLRVGVDGRVEPIDIACRVPHPDTEA